MDELLIKVEDAARALQIGRTKAWEMIARGDLPVVHIGRSARVPASAVRDLVARLVEAEAAGVR